MAFLPIPLFLDLGYNDFDGMLDIYMGNMTGITLLLGFAIFLYFLNKEPRTSKSVNWVAASVFGVYLIHENPTMHQRLWNDWLNLPQYFGDDIYPLVVIAVTLLVFTVCVLIDKARIYLVFKPMDRYLQRFYAWAESLVARLGEKADASLKRSGLRDTTSDTLSARDRRSASFEGSASSLRITSSRRSPFTSAISSASSTECPSLIRYLKNVIELAIWSSNNLASYSAFISALSVSRPYRYICSHKLPMVSNPPIAISRFHSREPIPIPACGSPRPAGPPLHPLYQVPLLRNVLH
jgi:hypothetical protein